MRPPPRPRDRLGRPLGRAADPALIEPGVPARTDVTAGTALAEAADWLARGRPFHAHEVYEQRWRCAPQAERPAWRALAQYAAARTHQARGNPRGARALAARAGAGLADYTGPPLAGPDATGRRWRADLAAIRARCLRLAATG